MKAVRRHAGLPELHADDSVPVSFAWTAATAKLSAVNFHHGARPLTAGSPLVSSTHELSQIAADYQ